jgi:regulator of sirC expression with transglutaminase-like and TPR domain
LAKLAADYRSRAGKWQIPDRLDCSDITQAIMQFARIVEPDCNLGDVRRAIVRIAEATRKKAKPDATPLDKLYALNEVFFQAEGFARDSADPTGGRPESMAASRVVKSHAGSSLGLAGIYAAVASELELPVFPVVTPYHAFARYDDGKEHINIELTEAGGHFDDAIYKEGYGLGRMPSAAELKQRSTGQLIAAQAATLAEGAWRAGDAAAAKAALKLSLSLDPDGYGALHLQAVVAEKEGRPQEALKMLERVVRLWPDYAAPRLTQGEAMLQGNKKLQAAEAFQAGIRAKLKPGPPGVFAAELYYRIAEVYAPLAKEALRANKLSAIEYTNQCNNAIVQCLKLNPYHERAKKLLIEMGGSISTE